MKSIVCAMWITLAAATAGAADLGPFWHDGKAEVSGYRLTVSRYGENRDGTAVMIFVTEPFNMAKRVKEERPPAKPRETTGVLKLNLVRDFQTGIYDYNTMVSVFASEETLQPVKVSFSSAEWCGHVYSEMRVDAASIRGTCSSYFEDESGPISLGRPSGGIMEDELFIALRGLKQDFLAPGASTAVAYLPGTFYARLSHQPLAWTQATITRAPNETITVPAGSYACKVYQLRIVDDRTGTFWIEDAAPHRIVKWTLAPDVNGELTGSARLAYWRQHAEGDEAALKQLGLEPQ